MKSRLIKISAGLSLLTASAMAFASQHCCGDLACCVERLLACCL